MGLYVRVVWDILFGEILAVEEYYFYCTLIVVLSWPKDGRSRPKRVAKYYLILIIASCLMYVVY